MWTAHTPAREVSGLRRASAPIIDERVAQGEGPAQSMRVIVPLLLSLAMWAFILLGLAGLWLKVFAH
jgi:hypothetical protein